MIQDVDCDIESLMSPVRLVLGFDLETLARDFTEEERLHFYNQVSSSYKKYLLNCSSKFSRETDRAMRGEFTLARLLLAASFKVNGEDHPDITGRFREDEYRILFDFEDMKIIDYLSVEDIVEFIERREGKVYEVVKNYYDRQYYMLDTKWGKLMGPLAGAFNSRYKERRRKIENAVVEYLRKRPLTLFISEVEEAVKKALESRQVKHEAVEITKKYDAAIEKLERKLEALWERISQELSTKNIESAVEKIKAETKEIEELNKLVEEMHRAKQALQEKEQELLLLANQYKQQEAAYELLQSEAESLREKIRLLEDKIAEYENLV
jgi:archaellum component FlaC